MPVQTKTDYTLDEQREITSSTTGQAQAVASVRHTATREGRTVIFGEYDPGKVRGRAQDPQFEATLVSMKMRHEKTGISAATIINMLPISLVVNSPMDKLKVRVPPALGANLDFTCHTWEECAIEVKYLGDGVNTPWEFHPIQLAEAFESEYYAFGGVVAITGFPTESNLAANREKIDACLERMYVWMMEKIIEANGFWNTANHGAAAAIVDVHRVCAMRMFELGRIPELPPWIQAQRSASAVEAKCPFCAFIPEPGAVICLKCSEVLDPAAAFARGKITEEHASLERLTRAEVEELGISAYVAETSDEKGERLKAGKRKPLSIAHLNALAEDELAQQEAKKSAKKTKPETATE